MKYPLVKYPDRGSCPEDFCDGWFEGTLPCGLPAGHCCPHACWGIEGDKEFAITWRSHDFKSAEEFEVRVKFTGHETRLRGEPFDNSAGWVSMHVDMTVHSSHTVDFLRTKVGANTHEGLANLGDTHELVFIDAVRDMKLSSGICFISKELADALNMKQGQRGQLTWQI